MEPNQMAVSTSSGARVYFGTTAAIDFTSDATAKAAFEGDTYQEVGEVQNLGEFGDESSTVTFQSLGDSRVRNLKGAANAGVLALVVGRDPTDAGQVALRAAQKTRFEYNVKIVLADAEDEDHSDSVFYLRVLVMSDRRTAGSGDDVTTETFNLGINHEPLEITSELVSSGA